MLAKPRMPVNQRVSRELKRNYMLYLMASPVTLYFLLFHYGPMYGVMMAFKDYRVGQGLWASPWVGAKHFQNFFNSPYFFRTLRNTLLISCYSILFGFPAPILLALLLNEVKRARFKRTVQTITYLPHFVSTVVMCGIIIDFFGRSGVVTQLLHKLLGMRASNLLLKPELFRTIYVSSGVWQTVGWSSIVYLAAIAGIDQGLYEAAALDGAGRWRCMWHITLPGLKQTVVVLLIMQIGKMMNVSADKIILLYNNSTMETADVISSYVYRRGLLELNWSFSTAVGLFNSVINCALVVGANAMSRRLTESSLF